MHEIMISNHDGKLTVSSLQVASSFGRKHKNVVQSIEKLIEQTSAENLADLFIASNYCDNYGRQQKCYDLTRDGFCLLVMGFTGREALEWKLKYIEAFNQMEDRIRNNSINLEEVIARAVTMAVSETVKALRPMLERPAPEMLYETFEPDVRLRRSHSVISQLDPMLRTEVDDMLLSQKYTYEEVRQFLASQGIGLSIAAIGRYKQRLYRR